MKPDVIPLPGKKKEKGKKKKPLPGPAAPVVLPQNASNINSNTDLLRQSRKTAADPENFTKLSDFLDSR